MGEKDEVFITFYEKYTLDNIKTPEQKEYFKSTFKNGLTSDRQENFLKVYDYLYDRLEGNLFDYEIEKVIQKNYFDYSDHYERHFALRNFASATILKNKTTGNNVVLISDMIFSEIVRIAGLSGYDWYKNLVLKSFRIVKILPSKENINLDYLLEKYVRDLERKTQTDNAAQGVSKINKDDLIIRYFKEENHNFKLEETFNKKNKIYFYSLIINDSKSRFEETIVKNHFLVMTDNRKILYLNKKKKLFKGFYIDENGEKTSVKFKLQNKTE